MIFNQTNNHLLVLNFEIICVNDGSIDNLEAIISEYMSLDWRVKYYWKPNGGLSSARNFGFDKALGKYILFCDSDDGITVDALETLCNKMESEHLYIVYYNF